MKQKRELSTPGEVPVLMRFGNTLGCPCPCLKRTHTRTGTSPTTKCVWASTVFFERRMDQAKRRQCKKDP